MTRLAVAVVLLSGTLLAQTLPAPDLTIRHVTLITTTSIEFSERQQIIRAIRESKHQRAPVDDLTAVFRETTQDVFQQRGTSKRRSTISICELSKSTRDERLLTSSQRSLPALCTDLRDISFNNRAVFPVDQLRHPMEP